MRKTMFDYTAALKSSDKQITHKHLEQVRQVFVDHHCGNVDAATVAHVLTQYVDLMIEACERDIERR